MHELNQSFQKKLFDYYDMSLKIDNVLGLSYKNHEIDKILQENFENIVEQEYLKLKDKNYSIHLASELNKKVICNLEQFEQFADTMVFVEKMSNFTGTKLKKSDPINFKDHQKFQLPIDKSLFQYGIAFNLLPESLLKNQSEFIPSFVLLFPTYDEDFNYIPVDQIFIEIKKFIGLDLTEEETKEIKNIRPYLVFNSKILDPYGLDLHDIEFTSVMKLEELQKLINDYLEPVYNLNSFNSEQKNIINKQYLIGISQNFNIGLTKIYNSIRKNDNINDLLHSFFQIHERKAYKVNIPYINSEEIITTSKVLDSYKKHYGGFDKEYALANTQRQALTCYLQDRNILPVNGAPGTGKTSLLRAIFGDYTVKAALKSYEDYENTKSIYFTTPIVCSSTNNQALTNISEGIASGFNDTYQKQNQILYKRWLSETNITIGKKNINFSNKLFVPSIKTFAEDTYELSKNDIKLICENLSQNPLYFLNSYCEYRKLDTRFEKIDKNTLSNLKQAAKYFYQKIQSNIKEIQNSVVFDKKVIDEISRYEMILIQKYIKNGYQEDIIKATLARIRDNASLLTNEFEQFKNLKNLYSKQKNKKTIIEEKIDEIKNQLKNINLQIQNTGLELEKLSLLFDKESNCIDLPETSLLYAQIHFEIKEEYTHKLNNEIKKLQNILTLEIADAFKTASLLSKISYSLFHRGSLKDEIEFLKNSTATKIKELQSNYFTNKDFIDDVKQKIKNIHKTNMLEIENKIQSIENDLQNKTGVSEILKIQQEKLISELDAIDTEILMLDKKIIEEYDVLADSFFEMEDIENFLQQIEACSSLAHSINNQNKKNDTSLRTENFYYAIHMLEALFFIANKNMWNSKIEIEKYSNKVTTCSICQEGNMILKEEKVECSNCSRFYSFKNKYTPDNLSKNQILYILENKKAKIDNTTYYAIANEQFINISTKEFNVNSDFHEMYPIFPIINITCNSFGTIVSNKDTDDIENNIFEFMLIDEAGTIPTSKMVILNCAKKVMLFGDTQQLKPVFSYTSRTEKNILNNFFDNNEEILIVEEYFSCADKDANCLKQFQKNNNAMDVANSSCSYLLPYNASKMKGDIWLKEHFRCQTSIVNISNEISYFNEIEPMKTLHEKTFWENLLLIEHSHQKQSNNTNIGEIKEIIKFIQDNREKYKNMLSILKSKEDKIVEVDDMSYYNSIGIITPFVNQEMLIQKKLKEEGLESIKVGTVHKYQGSEREIIIFSSVYNNETKNTQNMFFNRNEPDMINVAVTRAKEVFVLFGCSEILNCNNTYSGIMVQHIQQHQNLFKLKSKHEIIYKSRMGTVSDYEEMQNFIKLLKNENIDTYVKEVFYDKHFRCYVELESNSISSDIMSKLLECAYSSLNYSFSFSNENFYRDGIKMQEMYEQEYENSMQDLLVKIGKENFNIHDCELHKKITQRVYKNGTVHYVFQCQICGNAVGSAISKNNIENTSCIIDFDEQLKQDFIDVKKYLLQKGDI